MNKTFITALLALLILASSIGLSQTPRTAVPAKLVGTWYKGSVSSVSFVDPNSGQRSSPSGSGLFFQFSAGGGYANVFMDQTVVGNCVTFFMIWLEGSVTVEGNRLTFYPSKGQKKYTYNCDSSANQDRPLTPQELQEHTVYYTWALRPDGFNPAQSNLLFLNPDGSIAGAFTPHKGF